MFDLFEDITDNISGKKRRARRKVKKAKRKTLRAMPKSKRKAVKKSERKAGKRGIRRLAKTTKRVAKKTAGAVLTAPLLPFKPAMVNVLKKRGYDTSKMSFGDIINKFFNEVVSKKNNKKSSFEPIEDGFIENHPTMTMPLEDYTQENHVIGASIGVVVDAVVGYFKEKKKKKEKGEQLTNEEKIVAEAAQEVTEKLQKKAEDQQPVTQEQNKKIKKLIMFGLIGAAALILVLVVFKKK